MFKAISWGHYTGVMFLLLVAYYTYVGLAYYRVELLGLLKSRGKAPGLVSTPESAPTAPRPVGKKSLIAKSAPAMPAAPSKVNEPAEPSEEHQTEENAVGEELPAETSHQDEQQADEKLEPVADLPPFELSSAEVNGVNNYENDTEIYFSNDNLINFTEQDGSDSFLDTESGMESAGDAFYLDSTIGIAQLGDYLTSATEGQVTPAQLVEQEPGLANTELLLAFFQTSTKSAQRATAHLYEGIAEPALD